MTGAAVALDDLAARLLTLEIDTMVSDSIAAQRMPLDGEALIRIAGFFKTYMSEIVLEIAEHGFAVPGLPVIVDPKGLTKTFQDWQVRSGGLATFEALRQAAQACHAARAGLPRPQALRSGSDSVLTRIVGSCEDVQAMLRRLQLKDEPINADQTVAAEEDGATWPTFDRDAVLLLRRIWAIGVDVVVMQTTIRIDGGVTTRVLSGWDGPEAGPVHDLHYRGVDIALERWNLLVQVAENVIGFFFAQKPGVAASKG